jgi:hypothetical protein
MFYFSFIVNGTIFFKLNNLFIYSSNDTKFNLYVQVIIFCMVGLFDENIIKTIVSFLEWYMCACRSEFHTRSTLQHMDILKTR